MIVMRSTSLLLTCVAGLFAASAGLRAVPFTFADGVVVDPQRGAAYLMDPAKTIAMINLASGARIATTAAGAKPLALASDMLLAQAEPTPTVRGLRLVGLAASDLALRFAVEISLPDALRAKIDEHPGHSLSVLARPGPRGIVVSWRVLQRRVSGIAKNEAATETLGFAVLDRQTGRVLAAGSGEPPGSGQSAAPDIRALAGAASLIAEPCRSDDLLAALSEADDGSIRLHRWRLPGGTALPSRRLFGGELTFRGFSADCRDLLASRAQDGWVWAIFSTATGARVAELHRSIPAARFFVLGNRLYSEAPAEGAVRAGKFAIATPRRLVALDLETGRELWTAPICETAYLGPYPGVVPGAPR